MHRSLRSILPLTALLLGACAGSPWGDAVQDGWALYGDDVLLDRREQAIPMDELREWAGTGEPIYFEGWVKEVCRVKGCWMRVHDTRGNEIFVRFRDYGFFVPRNARGRHVLVHGVPVEKTQSVQALRHFASDAGRSQAEIDAITEPETRLEFLADAVLIQGYFGLELAYSPTVESEDCPDAPVRTAPVAPAEPIVPAEPVACNAAPRQALPEKGPEAQVPRLIAPVETGSRRHAQQKRNRIERSRQTQP